MLGDLPPSSSDTRFTVAAASRMISLPSSLLPVKAILSTPGWVTIGMPTVRPPPLTTLMTPRGTPHSSKPLASSITDKGVWLAGFRTDVQPAASAAASF